jgi:hypothetical protein
MVDQMYDSATNRQLGLPSECLDFFCFEFPSR